MIGGFGATSSVNVVKKYEIFIGIYAVLILLSYFFNHLGLNPENHSWYHLRSGLIIVLFLIDKGLYQYKVMDCRSLSYLLIIVASSAIAFWPLLLISLFFPLFAIMCLIFQNVTSNLFMRFFPTIAVFLAVWDNFKFISSV